MYAFTPGRSSASLGSTTLWNYIVQQDIYNEMGIILLEVSLGDSTNRTRDLSPRVILNDLGRSFIVYVYGLTYAGK